MNEWRATNEGRKQGVLSKVKFPVLLKKLCARIVKNAEDNLKAGFKKTGIFPFDKEEVLKSLSRENVTATDSISEIFLEHLKQFRYGDEPPRKRKKRLNVPAGQSVSPEDLEQDSQPLENRFSTTTKNSPVQTSTTKRVASSSTAKQVAGTSTAKQVAVATPKQVSLGQFVVISYEEELFPGKITQVNLSEKSVTVSCMRKSKKHWKWPETEDKVVNYEIDDIVMTIKPPESVNKRGILRVKELEYLWRDE